MRRNLLRKLRAREPLFPGILGYDDSVIPQVVNAVLSKHNMILLGLRGQAKSRLLREPDQPARPRGARRSRAARSTTIPSAPLCQRCRDLIAEKGDETPHRLARARNGATSRSWPRPT